MKRVLIGLMIGWIGAGICSCGIIDPGGDEDQVFEDPEVYADYGRKALQMRNFDQSIRYYNNALDIEPEHFPSLIGIGDALMYKALRLYGKIHGDQNKQGSNDENGSSRPRDTQGNKDPSETVTLYLTKSWNSYQKARSVRPDSPVPYLKLGRLIYEFKTRGPEDLERGIKLLKKGRRKGTGEENTGTRAKILYYLGMSSYYNQYRKDAGKRDFSKTRTYLMQYLDVFSERESKPPRESTVEEILMKIDTYKEDRRESRPDTSARRSEPDSD